MSSSSSSGDESPAALDLRPDDEWQDVDPEDDSESIKIVSFYEEGVFNSPETMLEHCKQKHGLDFASAVRDLGLEFYDCIKLVNYIRAETRNGNQKPDIKDKSKFQDDKFLQPVLEDDALLFCLDDVMESVAKQRGSGDAASERIAKLEEQLALLQSHYDEYKAAVAETLDQRWTASSVSRKQPSGADGGPSASEVKEAPADNDSHYFLSYADSTIHETMLKDTVRTSAYRDFIYANKPLFSGATVLDVGAGTGILSLFSARAGASKVFAVDNSDILNKAKEVAAANGELGRIELVRGKVEDESDMAPLKDVHGGVDILVSEWMGYCLLYEAMLPSVIAARDKYLKPNGLMGPSHCTLRIAPVADPDYVADAVGFWSDVYGFDYRALHDTLFGDVRLQIPTPASLASPATTLRAFDLHTVAATDLSFTAPFTLTLSRPVDALDAFVLWFDTFFLPSRSTPLPADADAQHWPHPGGDRPSDARPDGSVAFTTGPHGDATHWQAGLLLVDRTGKKMRARALGAGALVEGQVTYRARESNERELEIRVEWTVREGGAEVEKGVQTWQMR